MSKCYSCLKDVSSGSYCAKCKKKLFDGRNIKPLDFDKKEFYAIKSKMTDRMSISGVQDKISLTYDETKTKLVPTSSNGRFILKPIPNQHDDASNLDDIAANEHLSMQISEQVFGIPTASNGLIEFKDGELAYITKRFDYAEDSRTKEIIKLDQEDFASVLQYTSDTHGKNYKYDSSYEMVAEGIRKAVSASIPALEDFYKRIVLNYLIGNADAHLKNFSILRGIGRDDYSLSPNYDILYTGYHIKTESNIMGLELFDDIETKAFGAMGYYTLEDFEVFAEVLNIKDVRLLKIFDTILKSEPKVSTLIDSSYLSPEAKVEYFKAYDTRLKKALCYSINTYNFVGKTQKIIDKYL